jgi:hypothetical protein
MNAVKESDYCLFSELHATRHDLRFVCRIKELLLITSDRYHIAHSEI